MNSRSDDRSDKLSGGEDPISFAVPLQLPKSGNHETLEEYMHRVTTSVGIETAIAYKKRELARLTSELGKRTHLINTAREMFSQRVDGVRASVARGNSAIDAAVLRIYCLQLEAAELDASIAVAEQDLAIASERYHMHMEDHAL